MTQPLTPTFGSNKIASVLLKYNYQVKTGDILAGRIVGIEKTHVVINLGLKHVAFLPLNEIFLNFIKNPNEVLNINESGEFVILYYDPVTYKTIVSLKRLYYHRLWERFKQIDFKNIILFTKLKKTIWGGKLVSFDDLDIFLPNSHLPKYYRRNNTKDKFLIIKILEVKDKKHNIFGSSRLAFLKNQSPAFQVGMLQTGCVLAIKPFGIFINISGIKCLLHISEISNKKINDINQILKKGDQIKVRIIYINTSQGKIAVSLKEQ